MKLNSTPADVAEWFARLNVREQQMWMIQEMVVAKRIERERREDAKAFLRWRARQ